MRRPLKRLFLIIGPWGPWCLWLWVAASTTAAHAENRVIQDSWYAMQAGSTPWGYFHETIEERDGKFSYRYAMTKREGNALFQENLGAMSELDLTPITFNLSKSGGGTTEMTNGNFVRDGEGGTMNVDVQGTTRSNFKRILRKGTILDVFFPVWLSANWAKISKAGHQGWVSTFSEDPERREFRAKQVRFTSRGLDAAAACLRLDVDMEGQKSKWCITSEGVLVELKIGNYHVRRVSGESEAKAMLAGVAPAAKASAKAEGLRPTAPAPARGAQKKKGR